MTPGETALERAKALHVLRRYEECARHAGTALAADPRNAEAYAVLALARLELGDHREAEKVATAGLAHDAANEWLIRLRGAALLHQDRIGEAMGAADESIALLPGYALPHAFRGDCLTALGRTAEAETEYRRAIELDPENPLLLIKLGNLVRVARPAIAELTYRRALALDPQNAIALNNLGTTLILQKRPEEAALAFRAAILVDPSEESAKRNAHATVRGLTRVAPWLSAAVFAIVTQATRRRPGPLLHSRLVIPLIVLVVAAAFAGPYLLGRRRLRRLRKSDPQLVTLFDRLESERTAGRLHPGFRTRMSAGLQHRSRQLRRAVNRFRFRIGWK